MVDTSDELTPDSHVLAALRLSLVSGVGPRVRKLLLERFGSAEAIFSATPSQLQDVPGVGAKLSRQIAAAAELDVEAEWKLCRAQGIDLIVQGDDRYPKVLTEIYDPPGLLYLRGQLLPQDAAAIAIVGSRHATRYGIRQAERLAAGLARAGITVVSGLARGIDAAAHRGALAGGGRTLAVLGSGLLNLYPAEHAGLANEAAQCGAVISEFPLRTAPVGGAFPQRNRIISGMSLGVLVVEAAQRSGALITARHAMEQNREVFAMPGSVESRLSRGCHQLLRDGARLVETVDDILEELGPLAMPAEQEDGRVLRNPAELQLNEMERRVLDAIETEPTSLDQVVGNSEVPIHQVLSTISVLEMRRLVRRISGSLVQRL